MKVAILVQGRFHAFELGAPCRAGHGVALHTNYPRTLVRRWDPDANVTSFRSHLALTRAVTRFGSQKAEAPLHRLFGRWGARRLQEQEYDVVYTWSGVSEETLKALRNTETKRFLMRGSSHIRAQKQLLADEAQRTGLKVESPTDWMIRSRDARV